MLPLILVVLSQTPAHAPVGVVVSSKRPGSEAIAPKIAVRVGQALAAAGLSGALDDAATVKLLKKSKLNARDCQGASPCLIKLAAALGPTAIVLGVDVGKIGDSLAIHVEAVTGTASLASVDVSAEADYKPADLAPLEEFAKSVVEKLGAATPPVPQPTVAQTPKADELKKPPEATASSDAPKVAVLEPALAPPPMVIAPAPRSSGVRRALPWIVGGGAVASLGVAAAFFGLGASAKGTFDASVTGGVSKLPGSQLDGLANSANTDFTIGLATAGVGVALAACSVILFATE